jgi:hypothetical protein
MSVSDVLKVFEYLSMGLEAILQLNESHNRQTQNDNLEYHSHAAHDKLKQVLVASPPHSEVSLPGQIVND